LLFVFPDRRGKVESLAGIDQRGLAATQVTAEAKVPSGNVDKDGNPVL